MNSAHPPVRPYNLFSALHADDLIFLLGEWAVLLCSIFVSFRKRKCLFPNMPLLDFTASAGTSPSSPSSRSSSSDEEHIVGSWSSSASLWAAESQKSYAVTGDGQFSSMSSITVGCSSLCMETLTKLQTEFSPSFLQSHKSASTAKEHLGPKDMYFSRQKPPLHRKMGRRFSTDFDREKAWERKKELYLSEEDDLDMDDDDDGGVTGACKSAQVLREKTMSSRARSNPPTSRRTHSLTDEDLEELRGSIDLGFGFSYDESSKLKNTLPALELYYAINRQYADSKSYSTPASPSQPAATLDRSISTNSNGSSSSENWKISSPGDDPSEVKMRLRHWAQAVACHIKEGY